MIERLLAFYIAYHTLLPIFLGALTSFSSYTELNPLPGTWVDLNDHGRCIIPTCLGRQGMRRCTSTTVSKLTIPAAPIHLRTTVTMRPSVPLENLPKGCHWRRNNDTDTIVGTETSSTMSLVDRSKQVHHLSLYIYLLED
jgi:hypothetical protein